MFKLPRSKGNFHTQPLCWIRMVWVLFFQHPQRCFFYEHPQNLQIFYVRSRWAFYTKSEEPEVVGAKRF
jgi:hypothetical protein